MPKECYAAPRRVRASQESRLAIGHELSEDMNAYFVEAVARPLENGARSGLNRRNGAARQSPLFVPKVYSQHGDLLDQVLLVV